MTSVTYRDRVAELFRLNQGKWIAADDLAKHGGRWAWRTRVSDCRRELGMDIENRLVRDAEGRRASFYRWMPPS